MGSSGDLFMVLGLGIAGYLAWQHKDEIKAMLTPQTAAAVPVAPAPAPTATAEPLQAACCVCHAADTGFECLVVADPGKVYKYKKADTVEEATAQCIVDHCAGAEQDEEGNDLPPRENRRVSKAGADELSDLLNKRGVSLNKKGGSDNSDDEYEGNKRAATGSSPQQRDNFAEMFNANREEGKLPGAPAVASNPRATTPPQGGCQKGEYAVVKNSDAGHIYVECHKLSSSKYAQATDIYSRPLSLYGNMARYRAYESRMKWKQGGNRGWGGRDDDDHDRDHWDNRDHNWDNKHVWRLPRPIIRSNVVVYNPFAYYYAPPPMVYYPPVYPIQYW